MSRSHLLLRVLLASASLALLPLTFVAADAWRWVLALPLVLLTAVAVRRPESVAVAGLLAGHGVHWAFTVGTPSTRTDWLLVLAAAWLLLLVHVSASAAATWPERAAIPSRSLRRWGLRTTAVAVLVVPLWLVSMLTREQNYAGDVALSYAALAGLALLGGGVYVLTRAGGPSR